MAKGGFDKYADFELDLRKAAGVEYAHELLSDESLKAFIQSKLGNLADGGKAGNDDDSDHPNEGQDGPDGSAPNGKSPSKNNKARGDRGKAADGAEPPKPTSPAGGEEPKDLGKDIAKVTDLVADEAEKSTKAYANEGINKADGKLAAPEALSAEPMDTWMEEGVQKATAESKLFQDQQQNPILINEDEVGEDSWRTEMTARISQLEKEFAAQKSAAPPPPPAADKVPPPPATGSKAKSSPKQSAPVPKSSLQRTYEANLAEECKAADEGSSAQEVKKFTVVQDSAALFREATLTPLGPPVYQRDPIVEAETRMAERKAADVKLKGKKVKTKFLAPGLSNRRSQQILIIPAEPYVEERDSGTWENAKKQFQLEYYIIQRLGSIPVDEAFAIWMESHEFYSKLWKKVPEKHSSDNYRNLLGREEIAIVTAPKSDKNQSEIPVKNSLRSILKSMNTEQCVDNALLCDKDEWGGSTIGWPSDFLLDPNVAYGQPLIRCPSNDAKQPSQSLISNEDVQTEFAAWSTKNLGAVVDTNSNILSSPNFQAAKTSASANQNCRFRNSALDYNKPLLQSTNSIHCAQEMYKIVLVKEFHVHPLQSMLSCMFVI
ncbi:hypothetical protein ACS0TY_033746 [Phlomoides rotata]